MNINKEITTLRGGKANISFPTKEIIESLPLVEGKPDLSKLPAETIKNVILVCLENYKIEERMETFYVNMIATEIIKSDEVELKKELKTFLSKVLDKSVVQKTKDKDKKVTGLYYSWVIAQVLNELGINN